jgi:hypothetical protein
LADIYLVHGIADHYSRNCHASVAKSTAADRSNKVVAWITMAGLPQGLYGECGGVPKQLYKDDINKDHSTMEPSHILIVVR